jgi:hypothetical protein
MKWITREQIRQNQLGKPASVGNLKKQVLVFNSEPSYNNAQSALCS